jgi:hypothetical protein
MVSLKAALLNIEVNFVESYNKAKIMADLQFYIPGSVGLVLILLGLLRISSMEWELILFFPW